MTLHPLGLRFFGLRFFGLGFLIVVAPMVTSGCGSFIRNSAMSAATDLFDGLNTAIQSQSDVELVRQGLPTMMLLMDGLATSDPANPELRRSAAEAYSTYAQGFVSDSERAIYLYERARFHALALLRLQGFPDPVTSEFEEFSRAVTDSEAVDDLFVAGSAWLGWILADTESMEAVADVPRALALLERVLELAPDHADGAVQLVFAIYYAAQPRGGGQDLPRARKHFERAIELAGEQMLLPRVLRAEFIGKATLDQEFFVTELEAVVERSRDPESPHALANALARERAADLLSKTDRLF